MFRNPLRMYGLGTVGFLLCVGCLAPPESPRPLPPVQPDAFDFDPREPVRMPGSGSGYGSGVIAPTGRSMVAPTGHSGGTDMDAEDASEHDAFLDMGNDADEEDLGEE